MRKAKYCFVAAAVSVMLAAGSLPARAAVYGSIVPRGDVTRAFERNQEDPNLVYYHSGSGSGPDAIIGVDKAYTLDNDLWQKCTTEEMLKNHVSGMQSLASGKKIPLFGFAILDERGKKIGVWYSTLSSPTFVRRESDKAVDIHTPYDDHRLNTKFNKE